MPDHPKSQSPDIRLLNPSLTSDEKSAIQAILENDPNRRRRLGPKFFPDVVPAPDSDEKKNELRSILFACGADHCESGMGSPKGGEPVQDTSAGVGNTCCADEQREYLRYIGNRIQKESDELANAVAIRVLDIVNHNDHERDRYLKKLAACLRDNARNPSLAWKLRAVAGDVAQQESEACPKASSEK
jgi:hypothetical protein